MVETIVTDIQASKHKKKKFKKDHLQEQDDANETTSNEFAGLSLDSEASESD